MFVVFFCPASVLSLSGGSTCNSLSETVSPSPLPQLIGFHLVSRTGKWPRPGQLTHGILFGHSDWFRFGHPSAYKNRFEMDKRSEMAHSESQTQCILKHRSFKKQRLSFLLHLSLKVHRPRIFDNHFIMLWRMKPLERKVDPDEGERQDPCGRWLPGSSHN